MTARKRTSSSSLLHARPNSAARRAPRTLKPLRARQLIRRFHVLLKQRETIIGVIRRHERWAQEETEEEEKEEEEKVQRWVKESAYARDYKVAFDETFASLKVNKTPAGDVSVSVSVGKTMSMRDAATAMGRIDAEMEKRGGLETYQTASTLGQDGKRGGDSSKVLVRWLREGEMDGGRALEIGCLSSKNEISRCKIFEEVVRIDLHSQEPGLIEEQDFLARPLPTCDAEKFDLVSCSLVVNFVPKPELRGEMLRRVCEFLKPGGLLFFVIPLPCVENSRYCDVALLEGVFAKLGFARVKYHASHKLAYWLWRWRGRESVDAAFTLRKRELRSGRDRNNFAVVLS